MEIKCYQKNECYEFMMVHFVDHNIIDIEIKSFMWISYGKSYWFILIWKIKCYQGDICIGYVKGIINLNNIYWIQFKSKYLQNIYKYLQNIYK